MNRAATLAALVMLCGFGCTSQVDRVDGDASPAASNSATPATGMAAITNPGTTAIGATATTNPAPAAVGASGAPVSSKGQASQSATPEPRPKPAATQRPNVVLILADDLGYGDLQLYGPTGIKTPAIESLAAAGVRFTSAYATAPVCSPSRAGLLTGRYQQRFGHEFNTGPLSGKQGEGIGLPPGEVTLAELLKQAGYATGAIGKWHLGSEAKFHPLANGFDEFFGFLGPEGKQPHTITKNRTAIQEKAYLTDAFTREALGFIERHRAGPFFLYLPYNAPHLPLEAPAKYVERFGGIADEKHRVYAAMIAAMDDGIGAILGRLGKLGLEKNTLVVFLSDNGCALYSEACSNAPFSGGKYFLSEGGIRVPFIARWPGHVPAGVVQSTPVSTLDIFATVAAAAGARLPADRVIDGVNLLPSLTSSAGPPPHDELYWRIGDKRALRKGSYKVVWERDTVIGLFDLSADPAELHDLAAGKPEVVAAFADRFTRWSSTLAAPLWSNRAANPAEASPVRPKDAPDAKDAAGAVDPK